MPRRHRHSELDDDLVAPQRWWGDAHRSAVVALFVLSGAAALVYQVLWVRELRLLYGSTARSAAITLAIFFAGLALGGWFWGRRSARARRPLATFGRLEILVALTALGHFAVVPLYRRLDPALHGMIGDVPGADTVLRTMVAVSLLLPASFAMGGTLPMIAQHLVVRPASEPGPFGHHQRRRALGSTGTAVYALNTAGSALGVLAAAFVLVPRIGVSATYLTAVMTDLAVGLAALWLATRSASAARPAPTPATTTTGDGSRGTDQPSASRVAPVIWIVAAVSGTTVLALEVVWTRVLAQVLQNSTYTYSIVLSTFLLALALGAGSAHLLARSRRAEPRHVLVGLLTLAGAATAAAPWVLHRLTGGLQYVGGDLDWTGYLAVVLGLVAVAMGVPIVLAGGVFPFLLRLVQDLRREPGEIVGRLVAVNTVGAIAGALLAGFVILPLLGPWRGTIALAAVYPVTAVIAALALPVRPRTAAAEHLGITRGALRFRLLTALVPLLLLGALLAAPVGELDAAVLRPGERLVELREGPQATVAVVADADDELAIRVNTTYTLGGTRGLSSERDQALVPLLVHPDPSSVFFLGLGTGLTAGASLALPAVERVVVCELIGDVVAMSERHFAPWLGGLFTDPRVEVLAEDGRTCLTRRADRYDAIISDLFVPWEAGTGDLYSLDHYRIARERLEPGGVYVQWIPLFQLSDRELGIIANTMDAVFDEVVAWRGDFFGSRSALALVGHRDARPLDPEVIARAANSIATAPVRSDDHWRDLLLRHYVGNITASGLFADRPLNTDDRPRVEHLTPRTHRGVRAGTATFVVGEDRERLVDALADAVAPTTDPYLALLDGEALIAVESGRLLSAARWAAASGRSEADELLDEFRRVTSSRAVRETSPARVLLPRLDDGSLR